MPIAARLDEFGKPAWIVLMILSFIWWWPLGLAVLAFLIGSGRMGCWSHNGMSRWQSKMDRMHAKMDRMRSYSGCGDWWTPSSSGNRAFDDYRSETLQRLEEEQHEFKEFLQRLRFAKDREEFDQFMAERRNRPPQSPETTPPAPPQT
ncbi:MAG TPA: DUF2852 domain-containing protein [Xanthobacteraceae bacterium]|jgi:hypothetical protein|nr:DUF2852 domain-containing protein [Xanthobacteraceae bacterium]